jgi:16S rRNA (adenine(1408)-N(1))-methyltransferase
MVIGLDPAWPGMIDSARRCQREWLTNALFACASIEDPPSELLGAADEVFVNLPWGGLLTGFILGDPATLGGLRAIACPGATLRVVVGTDIWRPPVPKEIRNLPELTAAYVDTTLSAALADHGWKVTDFLAVSTTNTTWARRLAAGRTTPSFVELRAEAG